MFRDEDEAREPAQAAWVEVLASLPGFRGESKLGTWIYTVVYRKILRLKSRKSASLVARAEPLRD